MNYYKILYEFHYIGYVLDVENRPIEKANVTDELSSSVTNSFKNGSYMLSVGEGKCFIFIKTCVMELKI